VVAFSFPESLLAQIPLLLECPKRGSHIFDGQSPFLAHILDFFSSAHS
jgi:hypothetical protein